MIRRAGLAVECWCRRLCNRAVTNMKSVYENFLLLVSSREEFQRTIPVLWEQIWGHHESLAREVSHGSFVFKGNL